MSKSLRIDRVLIGVGRIARASGTDHAPTYRRILAMLTGLQKVGRLDVLAMIRDGIHAPLVVLHYYERGMIDKLPTKDSAAGLVGAFRTFAETYEASASYRADLKTTLRHLERTKGSKHAAVSDAPALLRTLKSTMRETPVAFNRLRAHLLAFASETEGKYGARWTAIAQVQRFKKAEGRRVTVTKRRPLTVAELDVVCAAFVDWPVYGGRRGAANRRGEKTLRRIIHATDLARMTRLLATSGLRPQEYWEREGGSWSDETTYIRVRGTKTAAAERVTFRIEEPVRPVCGEQFFRRRFEEATTAALREGLDVYSLRRTFATFCESARLEDSRSRGYLGHGPRTVTDVYLRTKLLPFVTADGAVVADWIATQRQQHNKTTTVRPITLVGGA